MQVFNRFTFTYDIQMQNYIIEVNQKTDEKYIKVIKYISRLINEVYEDKYIDFGILCKILNASVREQKFLPN